MFFENQRGFTRWQMDGPPRFCLGRETRGIWCVGVSSVTDTETVPAPHRLTYLRPESRRRSRNRRRSLRRKSETQRVGKVGERKTERQKEREKESAGFLPSFFKALMIDFIFSPLLLRLHGSCISPDFESRLSLSAPRTETPRRGAARAASASPSAHTRALSLSPPSHTCSSLLTPPPAHLPSLPCAASTARRRSEGRRKSSRFQVPGSRFHTSEREEQSVCNVSPSLRTWKEVSI